MRSNKEGQRTDALAAPHPVAIDSAAKRARLEPRRNPYWQPCGSNRGGLSIGYRRPQNGTGAWIVRLIRNKHRHEARLGDADDPGASGNTLGYAAALRAALDWAKRMDAVAQDASKRPLTVEGLIQEYVAMRTARDSRYGRAAEGCLNRWLLSRTFISDKRSVCLADMTVGRLTAEFLSDWAKSIEGVRPTSRHRIMADAKAALNFALEKHRKALPSDWAVTVREGLKRLDANKAPSGNDASGHIPPHHRPYVTDKEMRKIVAAACMQDEDMDFGQLAGVLASTGARFSQAVRIRIGDVVTGRHPLILVPVSRKGQRNPNGRTHIGVPVGADVIALLKPAMDGRPSHEPLLMHWKHRLVAADKAAGLPRRWIKDTRVPWRDASEMQPPWQKTIAQAGLSSRPQPYRLRDASIIRGLRAGQPVRLVAALHDTSSEVIERNYTQHIADALAEAARKAVVPVTGKPAAQNGKVGE